MRQAVAGDALSELAPLLRVRPELQDFCRFGGAWSAAHAAAATNTAYFHLVTKGRCLLERPGNQVLELDAGDILLLPHGDGHVVRAHIAAGRMDAPMSVEYENAIRRKSTLGVTPDTELVCGQLHFEAAAQSLIIAALPDTIVLRADQSVQLDRFRMMMAAIRDEFDDGRAGALAIATDLASALFVMMLRRHLEEQHVANRGLLQLLGERMTARAVLAMIRQPSREWTLDALAENAATSRATLVRAFRKAADVTPLAFLGELRLGLARQRLKAGRDTLATIAVEVGYQSEAALSRAFHRRYGERPGAMRRHGGAGTPEREAEGSPST